MDSLKCCQGWTKKEEREIKEGSRREKEETNTAGSVRVCHMANGDEVGVVSPQTTMFVHEIRINVARRILAPIGPASTFPAATGYSSGNKTEEFDPFHNMQHLREQSDNKII